MEGGSRGSQEFLHIQRDRVVATEHTPSDPLRVFERRHGLTDIVERGAAVAAPAPAAAQTTNQSTNVNGVNLGDSWTLQEHVDTGQGQG